jgi:hypothetical protein
MVPVLTKVSLMFTVPEAEKPVTVPTVLDAVHEKVVPVTWEVIVTPVLVPEQMVLLIGLFETSGRGKTATT